MSTNPPHRNQLWADVLVSELARGGLDHVALSPGSRSAPLALAFHRHPRITVSVHPDERTGAFFALGRARETTRVVATLTTSGSALANQYPAVVEAHHALVPLLVITADRPPHLQDVGTNQTTRQTGFFGTYTNWSHTLPLPRPQARDLRYLRAVAGRSLAHARGPPPGPVHLNVPFDEPLAPDPVPGDIPEETHTLPGGQGRREYLPWLAAPPTQRWPDPLTMDAVARRIANRPGIIVVGPRHEKDALPTILYRLAHALDSPIIADPLSGVRYHDHADEHVIATADAFLARETARAALRPEWILQFGAPPTSKNVLRHLEQHPEALRVMIDESGRHGDPVATAHLSIHADAPRAALMLHHRVQDTSTTDDQRQWMERFTRLEERIRSVIRDDGDWEGTLGHRALAALPRNGLLFVGSSLPVRDLDRYAPGVEGTRRVLANRGASGIDGGIASATGAAASHGGRAAAVIGDVAFTHDSGSLAAMKRHAPGLTLVVIRNGGGAIFGRLPIARYDPPLTELFLTPPEWDLKRLAEAHGLGHQMIGETETLEGPLREHTGGVIEVIVDRERSAKRRDRLDRQIAEATERALE